jgi:hypothetical protein
MDAWTPVDQAEFRAVGYSSPEGSDPFIIAGAAVRRAA